MALPDPAPANPERSDASLVTEIRAGSVDAIGALYERHGKSLLAIAYRLLQSTDDAEDVVHDVFVGLPEALRRYEEHGALAAWLRKITARVALAKIRQVTSRNQVDIADWPHLTAQERDSEDVISLEQAMRQLSPNLRAVLVLKEIEGFSHTEVAALLDISVGASEVRLHRAVQALRALLTKGEGR